MAPNSLPAKATELIKLALDADNAYDPSPCRSPNSLAKDGIDCTPPKEVVSYPKEMFSRAVIIQALNSTGVILENTHRSLIKGFLGRELLSPGLDILSLSLV